MSIDDNSKFGVEGSDDCLGWFISLLRRFTFCPSILSSILGVRFRRTLSVVVIFLNVFVLLLDTDVVEPNKRNGEEGMGLNVRVSVSVGFAISGCERFYRKNWIENEINCEIQEKTYPL